MCITGNTTIMTFSYFKMKLNTLLLGGKKNEVTPAEKTCGDCGFSS